jgi:hypothetical protein
MPQRQRRHTKRANEPAFDVGTALYRMAGVDLTVLEGIDPNTALVLLSEPAEPRCCGHSPSQLVKCFTVGKRLTSIRSRRVRRGMNRAGRALRLAFSRRARAER